MRLIPRSIRGRLLALSAVATALALVVAGVAIGGILERFVTETVDARLSDRLLALETLVRRDGSIDATAAARLGARIGTAEPWRIDTPRGTAGTRTPAGALVLTFADRPHLRGRPPPPRPDTGPGPNPLPRPPALPDGARAFEARLRDGPPVHGLTTDLATDAGTATIVAAVPRATIERPIRAALMPLAGSLHVLGIALALASWVQLRIGLRPLTRLRDEVAGVRAGRVDGVTDDQPDELAPLAAELNALVADNRAALAAARSSAANLAHGLKTPLATLALTAGEPGRDPDGRLAAQIARLEATVRHHLGRARAAAAGTRVVTPVAPAVEDIAAALRRIHTERGVTLAIDVPVDLAVAVDRTDLDEMLGNLADNAMRWARAQVRIGGALGGSTATLTVTDDGPGIPPDARALATAQGVRLDEREDSHGFGLAIVDDLARLYGGALHLGETPGGGLTATLDLPMAR